MRMDAGINGDAQRIEQMVWMLFLKVYDAKEDDWELNEDNYESKGRLVVRLAKELGKPYEECRLVVAHMGGGTSVGCHRQGMVVDVNNGLEGEGAFTGERCGGLTVLDVVKATLSGKWGTTYEQIRHELCMCSGLVGHTGTNDGREITRRIAEGDKAAAEAAAKAAMGWTAEPFTVPADKSNLLPSFNHHITPFENTLDRAIGIAVTRLHILCLEHHLPRTWSRRKFQNQSRSILIINLNSLYLLQLLNPRLHLIGLGRLITEPLNKLLTFLNHSLLIDISGALLFHSLLPQHKILRIRNFVILYLSKNNLNSTGSYPVQKSPVVGNQNNRTAVSCQIIFQPLN